MNEVAEYAFVQVVDELTSNAVKALRTEVNGGIVFFPFGTHIGVRLGLVGRDLYAQVWDPCPVVPKIPGPGSTDEAWLLADSGRGLALVRALSSFVGVVRHVRRGEVTKSVVVTMAPDRVVAE